MACRCQGVRRAVMIVRIHAAHLIMPCWEPFACPLERTFLPHCWLSLIHGAHDIVRANTSQWCWVLCYTDRSRYIGLSRPSAPGCLVNRTPGWRRTSNWQADRESALPSIRTSFEQDTIDIAGMCPGRYSD